MGKLGINSHPAGIRFSPVSMNCELIGININRYIFYNYNFLLTESSLHTPDPDSTEEVTILLTPTEPAENEDLDDLLKTLLMPTTPQPQQPETSVINASTDGQVVSSTELVMCRAITIGEDYQTASTNQDDFNGVFEAAVPETVVPEDRKPPAIQAIVHQIPKVVQWSTALNNYHVKSGGKFTISLKASSEFLKNIFS